MERFKSITYYAQCSVVLAVCVVCPISALPVMCSAPCRCFQGTLVVCGPPLNHFPSLPHNSTSIALAGYPGNENSIATLKRSIFVPYPDLEYLVITYSQVTSLENDVFQAVTKLKRIDLKNNRIANVNSQMFQGLTYLFELDLTGNIGCTVSQQAFQHLINLQFLYLGDLDLKNVDVDTFSGLKNLKGLDLHGNDIRVLTTGVFHGMSNLETLDLSFNSIASLPLSMMSIFEMLRSIQLRDNPWRCTCDLKWFKQLNKSATHSTYNGNVPICMAPDRLKYHGIYQLSDKDLTCIPPRILQCGGPYAVKEGELMHITCRVEGDLFPDIAWVRPDGNTISVPRIPFSSPQYRTVRNVKVPPRSATIADDGEWTISAANDKAKDERTFRVNVEMLPRNSTAPTPLLQTSTTGAQVSTTGAHVSTTGAQTSTMPTIGPEKTIGFLIAAVGFGGTVVMGLILFLIVACRMKMNRVVPVKKSWTQREPADDEITFVLTRVSE